MVRVREGAIRAALRCLGLAVVLNACSAYQNDLLPAPEDRHRGSGTGGGAGSRAGTGGNSGMGGMGGRSGSGGMGGSGGGDVSVTGCGDGVVSPSERCDTDIASGTTGACPTACPALTMGSACVARTLEGTACQAHCVELPDRCMDGDGCCPMSCSSDNDDDCSMSCGDHIVQPDKNETCEPMPSADAGPDAGTPCPQKASDCDDDDPCTTDSVLGSAANCNASCLSTEITQVINADNCCPEGANSIADDDCEPMCGNDVVEGAEECDGSDGCDGSCKLTLTMAQRECIMNYSPAGSSIAECADCACVQCTDLVVACRGDSDMARRAKCDALINCALANDCNGNSCYCGKGWETNDPLCLNPTGDCIAETQAAASNTATPETNPITILGRQTDTNYALGRAIQLGQCTGIPGMSCAACPQ